MWKQAADELAEAIDGHNLSINLGEKIVGKLCDWRSRPSPWIETARETPADRGIDGNVLAWHTIEGCHYTAPARTVADYPSEHPRWMEIPEGGIPEPRPEPKSPGDDEMSRIIELANKLTPQQNREMAEYLRGVADLDEERATRPEPTREQLEVCPGVLYDGKHFLAGTHAVKGTMKVWSTLEDAVKAAWAERGRG